MSEPKEKIDITYLKETFLECPVCLEHFNQTERRPLLLHSCLHAVCAQCLEQLLAKEGKSQVTCPLCRQVQKVSGNAKSVPLDCVRYKLVECLETAEEEYALCIDCSDGNKAESTCQDCSLNLCKECTSVHRRHRLTRDHIITSLHNSVQHLPRPVVKSHFCPQHKMHLLEFFCITDDTVCCLSCSNLDHKGHTFEKLEDVAKMRTQELETAIQIVQGHAGRLRNMIMTEENRKRTFKQSTETAKSCASQFLASLECVIKKREGQIYEVIDKRSKSMMSMAEKNIEAANSSLSMIESKMSYFTQAKERADVVALLQMYPSIKKALEVSLGQDQCQPESDEAGVTFIHLNGSLIQTLLSEVGGVTTSTDSTHHSDKHGLMSLMNKVCDAASESIGKKELLQYFKQKAEALESETCKTCPTRKEPTTLQCGHTICEAGLFVKEQRMCPVCKTGNMPPGEMITTVIPDGLPGNRLHDTIEIKYVFQDGIQTEGHPKPGTEYHGETFTAYLPNTSEGQKVLALLKVAWKRKLTFQIYHDPLGLYLLKYCIHHKKMKVVNPNTDDSYPDRNYLGGVQMKLVELGVTEDSLK
ncbi:E3 ubiquitin-protein ligase TRIM71-like [Haliotis rufescens]|uniref:E3 ubiquitin-protein ligase TRIM71-like n=1 Tax=Haliotis rufescens TaxID=6454 RepID=UPI00201F95DA|nr:E3 ubiquitin-protein ligase TRIM71-like [Haliotis rufescens]